MALSETTIDIDYIKANTNPKKYLKVPKILLFFTRYKQQSQCIFFLEKKEGEAGWSPFLIMSLITLGKFQWKSM